MVCSPRNPIIRWVTYSVYLTINDVGGKASPEEVDQGSNGQYLIWRYDGVATVPMREMDRLFIEKDMMFWSAPRRILHEHSSFFSVTTIFCPTVSETCRCLVVYFSPRGCIYSDMTCTSRHKWQKTTPTSNYALFEAVVNCSNNLLS